MVKNGLKRLEEKLRDLNDYITLVTVPASAYNKSNIEIIKILTVIQNTPGVYVTLNKPFSTLKKAFKVNGIDNRKIIFIDAVTKTSGGNYAKTKNCLFIGNPKNLSDISIAMDQAVMAIHGQRKFVFFDSLSTLLLFNSADIVAKFIHFLSGKMRVWKVKGIIISLKDEKENKGLINKLSQVCDLVFELGG